MARRASQRKSTGKLLRAALRYLKKQDGRVAKRARPDRMSPDRLRHTMEGENRKGYHYRPGGEDFPNRRVGPVLARDSRTGVYTAKAEFYKDPPGVWQPKQGNQGTSTFFPDDWTPQQVDNAVTNAFNDPATVRLPNGAWKGTVKDANNNDINIMGYYDTATGALKHGFPYL